MLPRSCRNDSTLIFLNTKNRIWHHNREVALHLALASQTIVFFHLLTREMALFRIEDITAAFNDLAFALSARTLTATR